MPGNIWETRKDIIPARRPGKRNRENAYAAVQARNTPNTVVAVATIAAFAIVRPVARRHLRQPPGVRTGTAALIGRSAHVVERDTAGRATVLRQDGWEIVFGYRDEGAQPSRLVLAYPGIEVRLAVDSRVDGGPR